MTDLAPMTIDGMLVRIRGKALQVKPPGWRWEIYITIGPDTDDNPPIVLANKMDFLTQEAALDSMKNEVPQITKLLAEATGSPEMTHFMDFKEGKQVAIKDWNKK